MLSAPEPPHAYPFRFLEPAAGEQARVRLNAVRLSTVRLSSGARAADAAGRWPEVLAVEVLAQAAARVLGARGIGGEKGGGAGTGGRGLLAAVEQATFLPPLLERPLAAGDTLVAELAEHRSMGHLLKVSGALLRDGERVFEAALVLVLEAAERSEGG